MKYEHEIQKRIQATKFLMVMFKLDGQFIVSHNKNSFEISTSSHPDILRAKVAQMVLKYKDPISYAVDNLTNASIARLGVRQYRIRIMSVGRFCVVSKLNLIKSALSNVLWINDANGVACGSFPKHKREVVLRKLKQCRSICVEKTEHYHRFFQFNYFITVMQDQIKID